MAPGGNAPSNGSVLLAPVITGGGEAKFGIPVSSIGGADGPGACPRERIVNANMSRSSLIRICAFCGRVERRPFTEFSTQFSRESSFFGRCTVFAVPFAENKRQNHIYAAAKL